MATTITHAMGSPIGAGVGAHVAARAAEPHVLAVRDDDDRHQIPRIVGAATGLLAASRVFGPGLMPRSRADVALGAVGSFIIAGVAGWAAASAGQWLVRGIQGKGWWDDELKKTAITVGVVAAAAGVGLYALRRWGINAASTLAEGANPAAGIEVAHLDGAGKRFLSDVTKGLDQEPVRAFAGLKSGASIEDRARALVAELDELGGWSKSHIVVASPTGSGFVEPVLLEAIERQAKGNVATVTMQSNNMPSALSVPKRRAAATSHRVLLETLRDARAVRFPNGGGPEFHVVGVSHGAWSSSDVFFKDPAGTMRTLGVTDGLFVGMPGLANWQRAAMHSNVAGLTTFNNPNDPVSRFSLDLIWKRPAWLPKTGVRPAGVNRRETWTPVTTFVQTAIDLKNATAPARDAGRYVTSGHEYREIIPQLVRDHLAIGKVTDTEFSAIREAIRASNILRAGG